MSKENKYITGKSLAKIGVIILIIGIVTGIFSGNSIAIAWDSNSWSTTQGIIINSEVDTSVSGPITNEDTYYMPI